MKKLLSILVLMALCLTMVIVPVQAMGEVILGESSVTIGGTEAELSGLPLTLKVEDTSGEVKYLSQTQIAADGTYSFIVEGLAQGESYTYFLRQPRMNDVFEGTFYVPSPTDAESVLEAFKGLDVSKNNTNRIADMTEFLTTPLNVQILNINIEAFNNLENSDAVAEAMCEAKSSLTSVDLISAKFTELVRAQAEAEEKAALIEEIASSDLSDMLDLIEENKTTLGIKTKYGFSTVKDNFDNGDEALAQSLKDAISDSKTPEELNTAVSKTLALISFNNESWGKYDDIETYYKEEIGSVFGSVKSKLTDIELTDLKKAVQKETFDDLEALKNFIAEETEEIIDGRKPSGGGAPSGGGDRGITVVKDNEKPVVPENNPIAFAFTDCDHVEWAKESILRLNELGIVNGKSAMKFAPDDNTKREEFLKMLLISCGVTPANEEAQGFTDVPAGSWYAPYIAKAVNIGLVNGISATEFGVGLEITREDMAVLCYRMLTHLGKATLEAGDVTFADSENISDYAQDAVKTMQSLEIIKGMGNNRFEPSAMATRAQAAVIIDRLMNLK